MARKRPTLTVEQAPAEPVKPAAAHVCPACGAEYHEHPGVCQACQQPLPNAEEA